MILTVYVRIAEAFRLTRETESKELGSAWGLGTPKLTVQLYSIFTRHTSNFRLSDIIVWLIDTHFQVGKVKVEVKRTF